MGVNEVRINITVTVSVRVSVTVRVSLGLFISTEDPINCSLAERHGAIWHQPMPFQHTRIYSASFVMMHPRCAVNASRATESACNYTWVTLSFVETDDFCFSLKHQLSTVISVTRTSQILSLVRRPATRDHARML